MEPKTRVAKVINKADKTTTVRHGTVERVDGDTLQVLIDNTASPITCARACVCVQGDRVVVVGKDAIATVGANYGSGGSGSIATTGNVLKGDNAGNAIAATPGTDYMAPVTLAPVATSGDYDDLDNLPTIPAAPVQSDWDEADTASLAYIDNKPALATVATSGSYNDLSDKPTIPSASAFGASIDVANRGQAPYDVRVRLLNSSGTELSSDSIPAATSTVMGVMTPSQYTKLDGIESGAEVNVQADWSEADSTSDAYIKNKPTIPAAGLPTGGSSGQVLAKSSGTDYDVTWVNQSGGGGGSIASTNGLLAGDGSGNAIAADAASMFVLEQYVVINGVSTANNGVAENTVTESKAGYFPLCVAGWTSNNRYPNVYGCRLTAQSVGSASIFCGASNFSGSTRTLTVSAVVLWVKVS